MSPYRRIFDLADLAVPIIQAPMAGATTPAMVKGAIKAGALGSLPCAMLTMEQVRAAVADIRSDVHGPLNLNFFCHRQPVLDAERDQCWQSALAPYYRECGLDPLLSAPAAERAPFDQDWCALVEELRPQVVSFHFGLPAPALVERVRATGARILSSATTLAEACWLADHGCDGIIVQGAEAGGHRGTFLAVDGHAPESRWAMATQAGLFALLPQVVDVVPVPVIAAGGIADARGIAAALALGASAVQIGTAYLFTPEAALAPAHRLALEGNGGNDTAITNLFTGRHGASSIA